MLKVSRTIQRPKSRLSKVRRVFLLMVAFVVYFAMAKPALSAMQADASATSREILAQPILHEEEEKHLTGETSRHGSEGEASVEFEMDEFIATLPHLNLLISVAQFEIADMCLPLSPYDRGVDYPPDALI